LLLDAVTGAILVNVAKTVPTGLIAEHWIFV